MRTYICDVCGKGFNLDSHLRKHKEVHSKVRENSKALAIIANECRGEARRINPRRFQCDQCAKCYTTNQKLKFHKLSAHSNNVRQYQCPHCPARLMNSWTLSVSNFIISNLFAYKNLFFQANYSKITDYVSEVQFYWIHKLSNSKRI